jgi:hypothetical protein
VKRSLRLKPQLDKSYYTFTPLQTRNAINESKSSSAVGPDGLTDIHLKHLGPRGLAYLTSLFNLSVNNADLPAIWKAAVIVPVLKPGKPAGDSASYRRILLLSPAVKVLKMLLLPQVTAALPKGTTQDGFAALHSCTTALLLIATQVAIGFNHKKPAKRSAMCTIDISKSFHAINLTLLVKMISESALHPNLVRWLSAYITGRKAWCIYCSAYFVLWSSAGVLPVPCIVQLLHLRLSNHC